MPVMHAMRARHARRQVGLPHHHYLGSGPSATGSQPPPRAHSVPLLSLSVVRRAVMNLRDLVRWAPGVEGVGVQWRGSPNQPTSHPWTPKQRASGHTYIHTHMVHERTGDWTGWRAVGEASL